MTKKKKNVEILIEFQEMQLVLFSWPQNIYVNTEMYHDFPTVSLLQPFKQLAIAVKSKKICCQLATMFN